MENTEKNTTGIVTGTILIVVLLALGGWYFFSNRLDKIEEQKRNQPIVETTEFSTSTEVIDIEKDLEKINIDSL